MRRTEDWSSGWDFDPTTGKKKCSPTFSNILLKYPIKTKDSEETCITCDGRGVVVCTNCEGSGIQPRFLERQSYADRTSIY